VLSMKSLIDVLLVMGAVTFMDSILNLLRKLKLGLFVSST